MAAHRHRIRAGASAQRRHDGSVDLEFWKPGEAGPCCVEHFTANEWVDLVSALSARGDTEDPADLALVRATVARVHVVASKSDG